MRMEMACFLTRHTKPRFPLFKPSRWLIFSFMSFTNTCVYLLCLRGSASWASPGGCKSLMDEGKVKTRKIEGQCQRLSFLVKLEKKLLCSEGEVETSNADLLLKRPRPHPPLGVISCEWIVCTENPYPHILSMNASRESSWSIVCVEDPYPSWPSCLLWPKYWIKERERRRIRG